MSRFTDTLNAQVGNEFGASQQYVAIAVWYDAETLPQLATFFYRQAVEERNHAMMLVQYLLDAGEEVVIPGIAAPQIAFGNPVEPVALALAQERRVTEQISALAEIAAAEGNRIGEQYMQWFLKEQLEEMSSMSALLKTVERAAAVNILLAEDYLARTPAARPVSRRMPRARRAAPSEPDPAAGRGCRGDSARRSSSPPAARPRRRAQGPPRRHPSRSRSSRSRAAPGVRA